MNDSNSNLLELLKKPYVKTTLAISVIIIISMFLTQSYWKPIGLETIYKEYNANETFFMNNENIPEGVFILSGNYSYIKEYISTGSVICTPNSDVKLLVFSKKEFGEFKTIYVMDKIKECK